MGRYTEEENRRRAAMQNQRRADEERRQSMWHAAYVGYAQEATEYAIEYRENDDPVWYSASPFYDPVRLDTDTTHNEAEAEEIAGLILTGKWAVTKQNEPGDRRITGVRIIERYSRAKIIRHLS